MHNIELRLDSSYKGTDLEVYLGPWQITMMELLVDLHCLVSI